MWFHIFGLDNFDGEPGLFVVISYTFVDDTPIATAYNIFEVVAVLAYSFFYILLGRVNFILFITILEVDGAISSCKLSVACRFNR